MDGFGSKRQYAFDPTATMWNILKYAGEGLVVGLAAYTIPSAKLDVHEIVTIALVAAATLSVADVLSPKIGESARWGSGLVIGANLAGGLQTGGPQLMRKH